MPSLPRALVSQVSCQQYPSLMHMQVPSMNKLNCTHAYPQGAGSFCLGLPSHPWACMHISHPQAVSPTYFIYMSRSDHGILPHVLYLHPLLAELFIAYKVLVACVAKGLCFNVCSLSIEQFRTLVGKLNRFISLRLFPQTPKDLPPMSKCHWWIPSCSKTLALLSKYNTQS